MSENYWIWTTEYNEGECVVTAPQPVKDFYELAYGRSLKARWSKEVICPMNPEFPKDLNLTDSLRNPQARIVSGALKKALEDAGIGPDVERLPVSIINHKGSLESDDYWLIHPTQVLDCIDLDASGACFDGVDPEVMSTCDALILKEDAIPAGTLLFRPKHKASLILMSNSLKKRLENAGFSGLAFDDPRDYNGLF